MFADWAAGVNATPDRETVERYVDGMVEVCLSLFTILSRINDESRVTVGNVRIFL